MANSKMKINKVSVKLIKPYTPTSENLKKYKLSFTDELQAEKICVILFYPSKAKLGVGELEESLAKTLVRFYPLAGRYREKDVFVDCNDEGAVFVEAEAPDVELVDLVGNTETNQLKDLHPDRVSGPLLWIQLTKFKCGGHIISISVSHKIFDASSLGTFVAAWSSNCSNREMIIPSFDVPSLLPCKNQEQPSLHPDEGHRKIAVKRLLFKNETIATVRSELRPVNGGGRGVSRVRVVCALIAKAMIAMDLALQGKPSDCFILQPINMRGRTIPPLSKHSCGNFSFPSLSRFIPASEAEGIGIQELVDVIGDAVEKSLAEYAQLLSPDRDGRDIIEASFEKLRHEPIDAKVIWFNDRTKFGLEETDFGWGKPCWATIEIPHSPYDMMAWLTNNTECDAIEALVQLDVNDIAHFEQSETIKLFAT